MKGKLAVMTEPGKLAFKEFALPVPEPGAVLAKTLRANVCGSEIHIWKGEHPTKKSGCLGHEMVGQIEALGAGVEKDHAGNPVNVGDRIAAGDQGGKRAGLLGVGVATGIAGSIFGVPMSAFGVAFLGNFWGLTMFGIGLLISGYAKPFYGIDLNQLFIPHGLMIGAGLVALVQTTLVIRKKDAKQSDDCRSLRGSGLTGSSWLHTTKQEYAEHAWIRIPHLSGESLLLSPF